MSVIEISDKFFSEVERFKSFDQNWDPKIFYDAKIMAKYGFCQLRRGTAVCAFCGAVSNGTNDGELVYQMHLRLNENCPLMRGRVTKNIPKDIYQFAYAIGSLNFNLKRRAMIEKARYQNYGDLILRKESFNLEQLNIKNRAYANRLATYGYFKQNSIIQCFHCGVHEAKYLGQFSIMEKHIITSPQCGFMIFAAGQNVIASILRKVFLNKRSLSSQFIKTIKKPIQRDKITSINSYFNVVPNDNQIDQDTVGEIEHNDMGLEI